MKLQSQFNQKTKIMKTTENNRKLQMLNTNQAKNTQLPEFKTNAVINSAHIIEKNGEVFVFPNLNDNAAFDLPNNLHQILEFREYANYRSRYYNKTNGEQFNSTIGYAKFIEAGIRHLRFNRIREFFYACSLETLIKRHDTLKSNLQSHDDEDYANNVECAFLSYINYLQFKAGTHDPYGNKRAKKVKVTFMSSKYYLQTAA